MTAGQILQLRKIIEGHHEKTRKQFDELKSEMLDRFERYGNAVASYRAEVTQIAERLDGHVMHSDLRHLGHERERHHLNSDIRNLRGDVDKVEGSTEQAALDLARAGAIVERATVDVREHRLEWREWLRLLAAALIGAALSVATFYLTR